MMTGTCIAMRFLTASMTRKLSKFFGDKSISNDPRDKDGTKADSGGTRRERI